MGKLGNFEKHSQINCLIAVLYLIKKSTRKNLFILLPVDIGFALVHSQTLKIVFFDDEYACQSGETFGNEFDCVGLVLSLEQCSIELSIFCRFLIWKK